MNDRLEFEKRRYLAIREQLRADDPELDEQTLADTTEGLTDLHELLAAIIRSTLNDELLTNLLSLRMEEMTDRRARFKARVERRRAIVRDAMLEAGLDKLTFSDFTASVRKGPPHVVITDETAIPQTYWEQRPHLLKKELLADLKTGETIAGASLSNPGLVLSVRTR